MAKILYDISAISENSGGINQVCRIFASHIASFDTSNEFYLRLPQSASSQIVRSGSAKENLKNIDIFLEENVCVDKEKIKNSSFVHNIYHQSRMATPARWIWRWLMKESRRVMAVKDRMVARHKDDAYLRNCQQIGVDIIHCPYQWINPLPPRHGKEVSYIMNLHDLQHEHYPQFFTKQELKFRREVWYESARRSRFVVAAAKHVRDDIVHYIGIDPARVPVIPWGPILEGEILPSEVDLHDVKTRLKLPDLFIYYPAMMWKHKNHIKLLMAIKQLRENGVLVSVVFSGAGGPFENQVEEYIHQHDLDTLVHNVKFVSFDEVKAIYMLAKGVVVPSLYEQTSGPVMEAMVLGCPVAAGNIADHGELLGENSGLLFDPGDVADIARNVEIIWTQIDRCREMACRAKRHIRQIRSWKQWVDGYAKLYEICAEERSEKI